MPRVVLARPIRAGRILWVEAEHLVKNERCILGRARHQTGGIEARGERDHPPARRPAVRGLGPRDAGKRRRFANRTAGIGRGRRRRQSRGHGG